MKKIMEFSTGQEIPKGAVYLSSLEGKHYFLVEVEEKKNE